MHESRRNLVLSFAASAAAAWTAGCAVLSLPQRITLTTDDIERQIEREFPLDRRLLEVFDVTLPPPTITLLPDRDRVAAVVDVRVHERLLASEWQGRLAFDAALRWDAGDRTLRMDQVRVRDLALRNPDAASRTAAERVAAVVAERMLDGTPLYRMPADVAARLQRQGMMPGSIGVTAAGIEITLVPFKP
jgi:Protein of unknown function (DUF1439)